MPLPIASYKLRFFDGHVRIVPLRDARGCAFAGPGVDLRGDDARAIFALARPLLDVLAARDPAVVRTLAIDRAKRRLIVTFEDAPRPRALRIDDIRDPAATTALLDLAVPLERRLGTMAAEILANRSTEPTPTIDDDDD